MTTFLAGQILTASALNGIVSLFNRVLTVQRVNNTTSLANCNGINLVLAAGTTYEFQIDLRYTTNTTADLKLAWTVPSGVTMDWGGIAYNTGESFTAFGGLIESSVPALGGTGSAAKLFGVIGVSSTGGTVQLRFSQNTMDASNTDINVNSTIRAWIIPQAA